MKKYTITGSPVRLVNGVLGLTEDQAKPRLHNLNALKKKGTFEIVQPVVFKAGEVIGFDGDIPKSLAKLMESDDASKKNAEALEMMEEAVRLRSAAEDLRPNTENDDLSDETKADAEAEIARLTAEAENLEVQAKVLTES